MIDLRTGHCLDLLQQLPAASIHCAITSPPYYGLRDYGLPASVWGGDPDCPHVWETETYYREGGASAGSHEAFTPAGPANSARLKATRWRETTTCPKCGAWKGCLGLEPSVGLYVQNLVTIFREVKRVLRPDGTLWLNLGDSYTAGGRKDRAPDAKLPARGMEHRPRTPAGLKEKDLVGVPWRAAFALQADGWILRSDVVWSKPNPLPESVKDRPTKSHEYIFLLAKSPRYYYDRLAVLEPFAAGSGEHYPARSRATGRGRQASSTASLSAPQQDQSGGYPTTSAGRNKRTVWSVNVRPFKGAHTATFPPDLVRPMILAGCPPSGTVLDPFGGSGTVGLVAQQLGRNAVLLDLNPGYTAMASGRIFAAA